VRFQSNSIDGLICCFYSEEIQ